MTTLATPVDLGSPSGKFVVFEGGDGSGKGTQINLLVEWLRAQGYEVVVTREPGGTPFGQRIRTLLLSPDEEPMGAKSEALLFAADRAHHVDTVIRPALARGALVVCDRYVDSSIAYQGGGRGLSEKEIADLSAWATNDLVPHITVVLDIDPREALTRSTTTEFGTADRIEEAGIEFADAARATYLRRAAKEPSRYVVIDATQTVEDVHARIIDTMSSQMRVIA